MEPSSEPGKRSPEPARPAGGPTFIRPPGLEFGRGLAIFSLVFAVFAFAQLALLVQQVIAHTPELQEQPLSRGLIESQRFLEARDQLSKNGDVLSHITIGADLIALLVLLAMVYQWKRKGTRDFLALRLPFWKPFMAWSALFIGVFTVLEFLAAFIPQIRSDFMEDVNSSITNMPLAILGFGVMAPLFEEILIRGLLFRSLRYLLDKHTAVALTAGAFTMIHLQYNWILMLVYVLPMGIILGYARANTGSIWTGVFLHMLNNALSIVLPQFL